jgi:hypothetical protein
MHCQSLIVSSHPRPFAQPYAANQYGAPYSPPPAQQAGYPAEGQSQQPYQQPYAAGYAPNQYAQPQYEAGYPQQYAQQPQASYAAPPQYAPAYVPQGYSDREQQQQQQLPVQHEGFSPIVSHEPSVGVGHGSDEVIKGLNYDDAQNGGGVTKKYNDVGFLVAFLLHLGAIVVLAIVYGTKMVRDINSSAPNQPVAGDTQKETSDNTFISIL